MSISFVIGCIVGGFFVGLIATAVIGDLKDDITSLRNALAREQDNTWHQVDNVLELADSEAAQRDREHYRNEIALPDWEAAFKQVYEGGQK